MPKRKKGKLKLNPEGTNQERKVGMFLKKSDLDTVKKHPHLGMASNPCPGKGKR
jgi:hypothetical protein